MWLSLLFAMTVLIFLLPLLPALLELWLKQDVSPVRVDQAHAGNIDHFAGSFMTFIQQAIDDHQAGRNNALAPESCCLLENDGLFKPAPDELKHSRTNRLIVGTGHLYLPDQFNFTQEIFGKKDIMGGKNNRIRSVLALGDLELGANSELLRWAHARKIKVGTGCTLLGRVSAEEVIVFQPECEFTRVNARRIYIQSGDSAGILDEVFCLPEKCQKTEVSALQSHVDDSGRVLLNSNLDFPEQGFWKGDLIVRGNALIRREAQISGNLKVYGQLRIEPGVNITGSIVCHKNIVIANACVLGGPLVAERQIDIDAGTRIGGSGAPTTITAPVIRIASGVTIYGTIWARMRGETLASLGSIEMPRRNPNNHKKGKGMLFHVITTLFLLCLLIGNTVAIADELTLDGYQRPDGAITIFYNGDNVDPYFATKALLVAHDAGLDIRRIATHWITWGLQHQRPDGGFDRYCRKGEALIACAAADADDAVAAVWIELLAKLAPAEGLPPAWEDSLRRANQLLTGLYNKASNVYFISASQPVGLLMDNVEVYTALQAMSQLKRRLGDQNQELAFARQADYLANNIVRVFWQPCLQKLRVSTQLHTNPGFYPDQVAEVFPILAQMQIPGRDQATFFSNWLAGNRSQWFRLAPIDYPWGLVAIATEKMGHREIVGCWLALSRKLRHGKHWNVLEEASFEALESQTKATVFNESSCPVFAEEPAKDAIQPPVPSGLIIYSVSDHAIELRWNASTGNDKPAGYEIYRNGEKIDISQDTAYTDKSVTPGTSYTYSVRAFDLAQNYSGQSTPVSVTTETGNVATVYLATDWPKAAIRATPEGNKNEAASELAMDDACPRYKVKTLKLGPALAVSVAFKDTAGSVDDNHGKNYLLGTGISTITHGLVSQGTDPCLDRTPPAVPDELSQIAVDSASVKIAWKPATDNSAVTGYKVFRNGAEIAQTQDTSYADLCVSPITTYQYQVSAVDSSGNLSPPSGLLIVTTMVK